MKRTNSLMLLLFILLALSGCDDEYCPPTHVSQIQIQTEETPTTAIPEPSTLALLTLGLAGAWKMRKK